MQNLEPGVVSLYAIDGCRKTYMYSVRGERLESDPYHIGGRTMGLILRNSRKEDTTYNMLEHIENIVPGLGWDLNVLLVS